MNTLEQEMAKELLRGELIPEENWNGEKGFSCNGYFFYETDEPVMSRPTIGHPEGVDTGRKKWIAETTVVSGGSYWEPPDEDVIKIAKEDSLVSVIVAVAKEEAIRNIDDHALSVNEIWWSKQKIEE